MKDQWLYGVQTPLKVFSKERAAMRMHGVIEAPQKEITSKTQGVRDILNNERD